MEMMLYVALSLWNTLGLFLAPVITVEFEPTTTYPNAYAFARRYGVDTLHIVRCDIFVNPDGDFDALSTEQQQVIVSHEVGHCLGMDHIDGPALMARYPLFNGGVITEADVAEFQRTHPVPPVLPYRAFVSVAHD